jgi:hypothetical protein
MGNSSAVQQLALAAKDYANNLYNDKWNRQFQTSQANMQGQTQKLGQMLQAAGIIQDADQFEKTLSNSNFWNQKDLDYKNAVRTDSNNQFKTTMDYNYDKMAQDKDLTMYGINHQGSGGVGSNGLTVGQQLDMQDAVAGYKGGLLNMLTGYGMNPIRNQKDFDALNSNYSAANGYISTLPGYAQNEVRNFFNGSDWAKYYNSNKGWKPTAGSGGFFDTVFGAPPASGVKPPAKYPDIKK